MLSVFVEDGAQQYAVRRNRSQWKKVRSHGGDAQATCEGNSVPFSKWFDRWSRSILVVFERLEENGSLSIYGIGLDGVQRLLINMIFRRRSPGICVMCEELNT